MANDVLSCGPRTDPTLLFRIVCMSLHLAGHLSFEVAFKLYNNNNMLNECVCVFFLFLNLFFLRNI